MHLVKEQLRPYPAFRGIVPVFILAAIAAGFLLPGDAHALPPDTSARSVGSLAAYSTGTVAISADGYTITLTGGAFSNRWGWGDKLVIGAETDYVRSWIGATQILLKTQSSLGGQGGKAYTLSRSYADLSDWVGGELTAATNLVASNIIAEAVCYNDGIDNTSLWNIGSISTTTDQTHYAWIYVPPAERHGGKVGQGYRLAPAGVGGVSVNPHHIRIEGIAFQTPSAGAGLYINTTSPAATDDIRIEECLFYNAGGAALTVDAGGTAGIIRTIIKNCFVVDAATYGIDFNYGNGPPLCKCVQCNHLQKRKRRFSPVDPLWDGQSLQLLQRRQYRPVL
jgi:hypothetical protein